MFIVQPKSSFGGLICKGLDSETAGQRQWQTFEFAVAWVNRAGAKSIKDSARNFLAQGGCIRATVGLDFSNTSYEGLGILLDLGENATADITTHVFFDRNSACTFHPKVFLFSNNKKARLIVGSNNMTGAGLKTNVEAALEVTDKLGNETIRAARRTLAAWRKDKQKRTRRLTPELLKELRDRGYVSTEKEIRDRRKSATGSRSSKGEPLFGRSKTPQGKRGPATGGGGSGGGRTPGFGFGKVLLMRVRPRRGGKQLQISMRVHATFMKGAKEVVASDGSRRSIGYNEAKGVPNTARFEAPEMDGMKNPVARFQWVNKGNSGRKTVKVLKFELFDANRGGKGAVIFKRLKKGISTPPVTNLKQLSKGRTVLSKSKRATAQWYRLHSV